MLPVRTPQRQANVKFKTSHDDVDKPSVSCYVSSLCSIAELDSHMLVSDLVEHLEGPCDEPMTTTLDSIIEAAEKHQLLVRELRSSNVHSASMHHMPPA